MYDMNIYIDSENVSTKSFKKLLRKYNSETTLIKVYNDWKCDENTKWYKTCKSLQNNYTIKQVQCIKKPKQGSIDNAIIADIYQDITNDMFKRLINSNTPTMNLKMLDEIVIFSNDYDYIQIIQQINTTYNYTILLQTEKDLETTTPLEENTTTKMDWKVEKLQRLNKRLTRLDDLCLNSEITKEEYTKETAKVSEKIKAIHDRIDHLQSEPVAVVEPVHVVQSINQSTKQQNRLMELETLKSKAVKLNNRKTELLKANNNNPKNADVQRVVAKISRIEKQIKRVEDKIHKKQE